MTILISLYLAQLVPVGLAIGYVMLSLVTFVVYAVDKQAAKQNRWRIKEIKLHILSLAGGWPGALLAQYFLRHKTQKQPFRAIFWSTLVANLGLVYILTDKLKMF